MNCDQVQQYLQALVDGELSSIERASVEAHLAVCPLCTGELERYQQVDQALQTLPLHLEPADFTAQVMDLIATEKPVPTWQQWLVELRGVWRWQDVLVSGSLASSMTVVGFTLLLLHPQLGALLNQISQQANSTIELGSEQLRYATQSHPLLILWIMVALAAAVALATTAGMLTSQWSKLRARK